MNPFGNVRVTKSVRLIRFGPSKVAPLLCYLEQCWLKIKYVRPDMRG